MNTTDFEVYAAMLAGALFVIGLVLWILVRRGSGRFVPFLLTVGLVFLAVFLADGREVYPLRHLQYEVSMRNGQRAASIGDVAEARRRFYEAELYADAVWSLEDNDWRLALAKVERQGGDYEEARRLMGLVLRNVGHGFFDLTYAHRAFAVETFGETDPAFALAFLPGDTVEHMSVGMYFSDEKLAYLYDMLYEASRARDSNVGHEIYSRGLQASPAFAQRHGEPTPLSPEAHR